MIATILSSVLGALLGFLSSGIYKWYNLTRPLTKLLGTLADQEKKVYLVIPRLYSNEEKKFKTPRARPREEAINWNPIFPLYAEGDARAMMYAYNLLLGSGKKINLLEIKTDVELRGDDKQLGLICIGAGSNSITKDFLTKIKPPIDFEERRTPVKGGIQVEYGLSIIDRKTNEKWKITNTDDFGLIIRMNNPANPKVHSLILAGLGPAGTAASAFYLSTQWRQIYTELSKEGLESNYGLVIKTSIDDYTDVKLIKVERF